jgi:hypothetical protein
MMMSNLNYEIQELYIDGHEARGIASMLDMPLGIVLEVLDMFGVNEDVLNYEDTVYYHER